MRNGERSVGVVVVTYVGGGCRSVDSLPSFSSANNSSSAVQDASARRDLKKPSGEDNFYSSLDVILVVVKCQLLQRGDLTERGGR